MSGQEVDTKGHKAVSGGEKPDEVLVRGCLNHVLDQFHFASGDLDGWVVLTGNTAGLDKYVNQELLLEGSRGKPLRIEGYFDPIPSFEISRIVKVFEVAKPELAADFAEKSAWRTVTNQKYGVRFAHPESMTPSRGPTPTESSPGAREGVETVGSFEIPRTAYANANLSRGSFTILVNHAEKTRISCMQLAKASSGDEGSSLYSVGNLRYLKTTDSNVGMGSWQLWSNFYIFRNGFCYEISFELAEYNAQNADTGCNIPLLSAEDNWDLIKSLIDGVSFFRPVVHLSKKRGVIR